MYGYAGSILRVDLTTGRTEIEELDAKVVRRTIGGRGLAAEILLAELPDSVDPLGPENKLILATGPFQNTRLPGGTRVAVFAKSPLTGGWGEAHAAGSMGPILARAGFDAIIVEGKAPSPVYLWVSDGGAELRDASDLWGTSTGDTLEAIRAQTTDKAEVAAIGCAGENLVRYAAVVSDYDRVAGRSGLGAVMGAKGLKAIAAYGRNRPPLADPERVRELVKEGVAQLMADEARLMTLREMGTSAGVLFANNLGSYPYKNFREGTSDEELIQQISGERMAETLAVKNSGCVGCPYRCHRHVSAPEGRWGPVDPKYGGPEFETIGSFGSNLAIYDLEYIARANQLCNEYGLDTLTAGVMLGWAFESYERGFITKQDTEGLELEWGSAAAALELLERIARRQGIGDLLAEGFEAGVDRFGPETAAFAMHVKGQSFAVHMPRSRMGQALSYATSNRGACHLQGMHDTTIELGRTAPELGIDERFKGISRFSLELKPEFEVKAQHWRAVQDSLIVCKFTTWDYGPIGVDVVIQLLNAATGQDYSAEEIRWVGERAYNAGRLLNTREGMTRKDDALPARVQEPMTRGASKDSVVSQEGLDEMLDQYYAIRGWDANGIPTNEKLEFLDLPHD